MKSDGHDDAQKAMEQRRDNKLHIVLPATQSNVNMCKTLLSMAILDYPTPHIVAWGQDDKTNNLIGGGSHYAKITSTLAYINDKSRSEKPGFDDELIFMLDAYDIWFQLPVQVLLERYHGIVQEERQRVRQRMGRAYDAENIDSSIVFGGGKRCAPNFIYTLACYAVPESPVPKDIRRGNTDSAMGRNEWSSYRTRYLNSGYIIGPIGKMRPLLEKAKQRLDECIHRKDVDWDNGYGGSNECYSGSDQSIFVEMFGEQEFQREVMRRHHRRFLYDGIMDALFPGRPGSKPPPTQIMSTPILDMLNPEFSHQVKEPKYSKENPFELGMAIDYWSLLGHQTSNAIEDTRYIRYDKPINDQIGKLNRFDCVPKTKFPPELDRVSPPFADQKALDWKTAPLYTEFCVGSVPVMIHHNSVDKGQRERQWEKTWWHGQSRNMWEMRNASGTGFLSSGIPTDRGTVMSWDQLCPKDIEGELFRDGR